MSAEQEIAALRLMLRETARTNATGIDYALRCQRERDEAQREIATLRAAFARAYGCVTRNKAPDNPHQAAQGIIEEYRDVSNEREEYAERAVQALHWSRLWHREARRLWREVQALSARVDDEQTAMLALAHARRQVIETGYGHDELEVARRAVEAVADAMLRGSP